MIYGSSHEKDILHLKVRLKEKKKTRGRLLGHNDSAHAFCYRYQLQRAQPPIYQLGGMPLADEPLQIRRSNAMIWHSFWTQRGDKGVEEELMCQSEPMLCAGRRLHRSHKRAHRQDVVMVLGDSPGDRYTFCWVTARQIGPNRISRPGCPPPRLPYCDGDTPDIRPLC